MKIAGLILLAGLITPFGAQAAPPANAVTLCDPVASTQCATVNQSGAFATGAQPTKPLPTASVVCDAVKTAQCMSVGSDGAINVSGAQPTKQPPNAYVICDAVAKTQCLSISASGALVGGAQPTKPPPNAVAICDAVAPTHCASVNSSGVFTDGGMQPTKPPPNAVAVCDPVVVGQCLSVSATGAISISGSSPPPVWPTGGLTVAFFYNDAFTIGHGVHAATTYSQSAHANTQYLLAGSAPDVENAAIIANGYKVSMGLPYDMGWCGANSSNCVHASAANGQTWAKQFIDCLVAGTSGSLVVCPSGGGGATLLYVNEPDTAAPASGWNYVYNYVHTTYPGVFYGPIMDESSGVVGATNMLLGGNLMDFAVEEQFAGPGCCFDSTDDWTATGVAGAGNARTTFPTVKFGQMPVSTAAICNYGPMKLKQWGGQQDLIMAWNKDSGFGPYGQYSGLPLDADWLTNSDAFATNGNIDSICKLPQVFFGASNNDVHTSNITLSPADQNAFPGWTPTSTRTSCFYSVISGPNAVYGINAPGNVVTKSATSRTCDGSFTVTVGPSQDCRDQSGSTQTCIVEMWSQAANGSLGNKIYSLYYIGGFPLPLGNVSFWWGDVGNMLKALAGQTTQGVTPDLTGVDTSSANMQPFYTATAASLTGTCPGAGCTETVTMTYPQQPIPLGEKINIVQMNNSAFEITGCTVTASSTVALTSTVSCLNPTASGTTTTNVNSGVLWTGQFAAATHAHGMGFMGNLGGPCLGNQDCTANLNIAANIKADGLFLDESDPGQTGGQTLVAQWKGLRPGGYIGLTHGDPNVLVNYLKTPYSVPFDFTSAECYVNCFDHDPYGASGTNQRTLFPAVQPMVLFSGTGAVCAAAPWITSATSVGFWDVDNANVALANPSYFDFNWFDQAQLYARTMKSSGMSAALSAVCQNIAAFDHSTPSVSGNIMSTSFTVTFLSLHKGGPAVSSCQYEVVSGPQIENYVYDPANTVTVPWTNLTCSGTTPTLTIGPGGNCPLKSITDPNPVNGGPLYTCVVLFRQTQASNGPLGPYGDIGGAMFRISF